MKTFHVPDDDDQEKKPGQAKGSARHGNAGVGEYFKPKPSDANGSTVFPPAAIDLTNDDDDDDDVQITGVINTDDKEVCYGMIDGYVLAFVVPRPPKKESAITFTRHQWPVFKFNVRRQPEKGYIVECIDPHGMYFGKIDHSIAETLAPVMDAFPKLRVQSRLTTRPQKPNEWPGQPCSEKLRAVINIYGRKGDVAKIGKFFGQRNIFFKQPLVSDAGIDVCNPHAREKKQLGGLQVTNRHHTVSTTRTMEEATDAVSRLFDYQAQEGNELAETEAPPTIITPLLRHQKQALTFMLRQEQPRTFSYDEAGNSSLWRKKPGHRSGWVYEEVVTGIQVYEEPEQVLGGLLADVMGLGKTIQTLSLIASTMSEATSFSEQQLVRNGEAEVNLKTNSRATLLVAPVSTVKNWEDQIREHTRGAGMTYCVYHGAGRERNPFLLADNDIVITTYSTAATEMFGKNKDDAKSSPLASIRWFRIVLDEAHTIRESKSSQAKAMYSLFATRRWCLTGTPIQNRIDDLGSLTRFLRIYPYDSINRFNQYVKAPAMSGDVEFLKKIRVMVDSFTLRRLRDQIDLPKRDDLIVDLQFSDEERKLHDWFREQFRVQLKQMNVDSQAMQRAGGGQYHKVLKGITMLRLICDHGKELLKQRELDDYENSSTPVSTVTQSGESAVLPRLEKRKAFEYFNLVAEAGMDVCAICGNNLSATSPGSPTGNIEASEDDLAVVLPCLDIICLQCFAQHEPTFAQAKKDSANIKCVNDQCTYSYEPQHVIIPRSFAEHLDVVPEDNVGTDGAVFKHGFYEGPHTKVKKLLTDIAEIAEESQQFVAIGQPPIKSVIFSEFTTNLDLIGRALHNEQRSYVRIDGTMSLPNRRKVIDALNKDDNVTILLASIKAAGQGLNLTAASRAFVMEPLWNPAAEAQAIDRIYRIGQKRPVVVRRYRMQSSMEDKIVELQERKKKIAEMSMEKQAMQKILGKKERNEKSLAQMLDFFKI